MYRTLFTNARASALFAAAIVLLATAFAGGQDADSLRPKDAQGPDKTSVAANAANAAVTPGSAENVEMGFMEDEDLVLSSEGAGADPDEMATTEEALPQDSAAPDETENAEPVSMDPEPDVDPSTQSGEI